MKFDIGASIIVFLTVPIIMIFAFIFQDFVVENAFIITGIGMLGLLLLFVGAICYALYNALFVNDVRVSFSSHAEKGKTKRLLYKIKYRIPRI